VTERERAGLEARGISVVEGLVERFSVVDDRLDGVWAVGNAANPRAQVITAAGEGSAAAIAINGDLVEEDVRNAVQSAVASEHTAQA